MAIDWAGYAKVGLNIGPKVLDALKRIPPRDPLVVLPDWAATQQRVWHAGVVHGVKQYKLEIDLLARLENAGDAPRIVKGATVMLRHREYGRLVKVAEARVASFRSLATARITQSFDDRQYNTIRVEPHSLTDPYYFLGRVLLPRGLVSLDRDYVAIVRLHTVGNKNVSLSIPIRCPDPNINMGFTKAPDA
jgi:hypothetical protein